MMLLSRENVFWLIEFFLCFTGTVSFHMAKLACVTWNSRCGKALALYSTVQKHGRSILLNCILREFCREDSAANVPGSEKCVRLHHFIYLLSGEWNGQSHRYSLWFYLVTRHASSHLFTQWYIYVFNALLYLSQGKEYNVSQEYNKPYVFKKNMPLHLAHRQSPEV